jgi:hypothetical protein
MIPRKWNCQILSEINGKVLNFSVLRNGSVTINKSEH